MVAVLSADMAERLAKLLGMQGSVHDGEALTAARLADRLVRDQLKLTWGEVIQSPARGSSGPGPPRVWREPQTWQDAARLAAEWPECLTDWERGFLVSVLRFARVSDKQLAILDRVVSKARGTAGVREPADPTAWHPPAQPSAPPTQPEDHAEAKSADPSASGDSEPNPRPRQRHKRRSRQAAD